MTDSPHEQIGTASTGANTSPNQNRKTMGSTVLYARVPIAIAARGRVASPDGRSEDQRPRRNGKIACKRLWHMAQGHGTRATIPASLKHRESDWGCAEGTQIPRSDAEDDRLWCAITRRYEARRTQNSHPDTKPVVAARGVIWARRMEMGAVQSRGARMTPQGRIRPTVKNAGAESGIVVGRSVIVVGKKEGWWRCSAITAVTAPLLPTTINHGPDEDSKISARLSPPRAHPAYSCALQRTCCIPRDSYSVAFGGINEARAYTSKTILILPLTNRRKRISSSAVELAGKF
ncbi:hypothetical protein B0H14DRAFT_3643372 [Mycena olivaceomarginata]|nr:hypothetical protein B0H14DRAFT_3643372 [Mycena olivaceomarginata]